MRRERQFAPRLCNRTLERRRADERRNGSLRRLLEQLWLRSFRYFSGFAEIAETHSDQAEALLRLALDAVAEAEGDSGHGLAGGGRRGRRVAAGQDLELLCFQLEDYGSWDARLAPRG